MVEKVKEAHEKLVHEIKKQLKSSIIYTGKKELISGLRYYRGDIVLGDKLIEIDVDDIVDHIMDKHDVELFKPDEFGNRTRKAMIGLFKLKSREMIEELKQATALSIKE